MSSSTTPALPFAQTLATISRLVTDPRLLKPRIGIVCGSGLSTLVSSLKDVVQLPYSQLQGFGESTGMC
jgi:purine-nucleoside phosphorylase